jgi:Exonuclease VII, large subunit
MSDVRSVEELLGEIAAALYRARFGFLAVTGTLTDWRVHRHGTASAELVAGNPPTDRLKLWANKHTAGAIADSFTDAGYDPAQPTGATAYGQLSIDRRWGLRLQLARVDLATAADPAGPRRPSNGRSDNHTARWPARITTIGMIDPEHGDDARGDVFGVLADCDLTIIEHRVPVTGRDAPLRISRALDQLARDQRPEATLIVRGGGADIDLDVFNHPAVVAAIGRHPRPVVVGIGHATNSTHADEAAHTSCITPTAAATELRLRLAQPTVTNGDKEVSW